MWVFFPTWQAPREIRSSRDARSRRRLRLRASLLERPRREDTRSMMRVCLTLHYTRLVARPLASGRNESTERARLVLREGFFSRESSASSRAPPLASQRDALFAFAPRTRAHHHHTQYVVTVKSPTVSNHAVSHHHRRELIRRADGMILVAMLQPNGSVTWPRAPPPGRCGTRSPARRCRRTRSSRGARFNLLSAMASLSALRGSQGKDSFTPGLAGGEPAADALEFEHAHHRELHGEQRGMGGRSRPRQPRTRPPTPSTLSR